MLPTGEGMAESGALVAVALHGDLYIRQGLSLVMQQFGGQEGSSKVASLGSLMRPQV